MRHTSSKVCYALLSLLWKPKICLRNEDMTHWEHTKTTQFFRSVEDNRRETTRHFWVQSYLNSSLYFVLRFNQKIQHFLCMNNRLSIIGHQTNQSSIPFIRNLSKSSWSTCHQYLSNSIFKFFKRLLIQSDEGVGCDFFCYVILQFPYTLLLGKLFFDCSYFGEDSHFKSTHREKKVRIIFGIHWNIGILPMNSSYTSWQSILNLPEHTSTQIYIMLHQPHPTIFWPTLSIVITHHIFIIWIRVFSKISLDQFSCLIFCKSKQNINMVDISQIDSYRMLHLQLDTLEDHKFILIERRTCYLIGSI